MLEELRREMQAAIEDYLDWCRADGARPERSWSGKLTLRSDADFRRRVLIAAAARGQSVSAWINQLADRESRKILAELENGTEAGGSRCALSSWRAALRTVPGASCW